MESPLPWLEINQIALLHCSLSPPFTLFSGHFVHPLSKAITKLCYG